MDTIAREPHDLVLADQSASSNAGHSAHPTFISSIAAIAGGQIACTAVATIAELCFARILGPAARGLVSLCLMSIAFGSLIGSLGSEATVVVWISRAKGKHSTWFPAVMLWVLTGCLIAVSAWGFVYWKWHPSFLKGLTPELAVLVLVAIPATVFFSMSMALFVGEERFRLRSLLALLNRVTGLAGFFVCLAFLGRRPDAAILGNLFGLIAGIAVSLPFLDHFFRRGWRIQDARENLFPTMMFGIRGQAGNLASFFSYRLDVFVVNYFLDAWQVGLYTLGVLISEALWQLPAIVSVALFPRTARTVGAGADAFTCMVVRQVLLITLLMALLVAVASPFAVPLLFGSRYSSSIAVIWWILPGTVALSLGKVIAADLTGRGKNIHLPISASIGFLLTITLDFLLIPIMGIQGAALASSVAYLAAAGYLFVVIQRELRTSWTTLLVPTRDEWRVFERFWLLLRLRFGAAR